MTQCISLQQWMGRSTHLLRAYARWSTFAAAIVALATFIVNDALRNDASDLSNAVRQARTDYSIKKDVESVYDVAISIQVKLDDFEYRARKFANDDAPELPDIQAWELVDMAQHERPAIFTESAALSNAVDLNDRLPYDQMLDKEHWILIRYLNHSFTYQNDSRRLADMVLYTTQGPEFAGLKSIVAHDRAVELQDFDETSKEFGPSIKGPPEAIQRFCDAVYDRAEHLQGAAERRVRFWKVASFVLYPVALLIGIVGKLSGNEESQGGETI